MTAYRVRRSRYWATNTTIVDGPAGDILLIDPGVYPDELDDVAAALAGRRITAAVHTHAHWDHLLWTDRLDSLLDEGAHRFVTGETARLLVGHRDTLLASVPTAEAPAANGPTARGWQLDRAGWGEPIGDGVPLPWDGPTALLLATDAHLPGHGSLHLPELGLLVAGDLLSDVDVPFPFWPPPAGYPQAEGIAPYLAGLDRLAVLHPLTALIPGHGAPTDRRGIVARLDADRRYLDRLEREVAAAATLAEALTRCASIDERLADDQVRAAHDATVSELFRQRAAS